MFTSCPKKILVLAVVLLLTPTLSLAKTIQFKDKFREVETAGSDITSLSVRNEGPLLAVIRREITGVGDPRPSGKLFPSSDITSIEEMVQAINQEPKAARLTIEKTRAIEFDPGQDGQVVDMHQLYQSLLSPLSTINLPVLTSQSPVKLAQTNSLGINELVASGESNFSGSSKNRSHNIKVGAAKFNGIILKPGEEFSFNKFLGDVDAKNGFLPELVIKRTGVVPEFGGGLCQVSSTTFRATMNAGLPITERRNHSFAVKYYAPQGTDATIYPGFTDLKFVNNLSSDMLIWTRVEGTKLFFDFYGTKDDRTVEFDGPTQYDKKSDGSMKAAWTRRVRLNGAVTEQVFKSTYLPPALFYPVEQATTPNPQAIEPT